MSDHRRRAATDPQAHEKPRIIGSPDQPQQLAPLDGTRAGVGLLVLARAHDGERWHPVLDDHERARAAQLRHRGSRVEFIVGRGLLKTLLAGQLGVAAADVAVARRCVVCRGTDHGKPFVDVPEAPQFSLAHAGGYVLIVVARDGPVGADIEVVRPIPDLVDVARTVLSEAEWGEFEVQSKDAAPGWFVERWCAKEALTKRSGAGLAAEFSRVDTTGVHWPGLVLLPRAQLPAAFRAAVAIPPTIQRLVWAAAPGPPS